MNNAKNFREFIETHEKCEIQITDNIRYSLRDVINKNDELFHGKFVNPKDGSFTKVFYNIGFVLFRSIFQTLVKTIGTKDIQMRSLNGKGVEALALFRMAIKSYLNRIKFGTFLNDLCYFVKDGTTVVKIVDGEPQIVSNHNIVRPAYGELQDAGLAEKCFYSWEDMLSHQDEWKGNWDKIEKLRAKLVENGINDFVVHEWWGEHKFGEKYHKGCIKYLDCSVLEVNERTKNQNVSEWEPHLELERFKTTYKKKRTSKRRAKELGEYEELYPYKELHFIKVPGRSIGFSVFELIAGIQEAYNRKMNLHDKKDILDLMGIFKHKKNSQSPSVAQQLLDNIQSGKVVEMELDEDFERLIIDTKTGELIASVDKLFELARQITGVTMQGTGIDMPASMTATVGVLNKQTQQTTYDYAAEQVGLFLTELFSDFYLEVVLEEIDREEMNDIVGDPKELEELDRYFAEQLVNRRYAATKLATGMPGVYLDPIEGEKDMTIEQIAKKVKIEKVIPVDNEQIYDEIINQYTMQLAESGDTRWADIKKEFLDKLNYSFEFYVTNEGFDKNIKIQNLMALRENPAMSPEKLDTGILDLMGENPKQYLKDEEEIAREQMMMQMEQGGAPQMPPQQMEGAEFQQANPMTPQ